YFKGICTWYEHADIGVSGGELFKKVSEVLAEGGLRPALNPGHLTSRDEWVHTLVRPNSHDIISSGMAMRLDIIPAPPSAGGGMNCGDSVVFADKEMKEELEEGEPEDSERIQLSHNLQKEEIGVDISDNFLPLSSNPGYESPFWLEP